MVSRSLAVFASLLPLMRMLRDRVKVCFPLHRRRACDCIPRTGVCPRTTCTPAPGARKGSAARKEVRMTHKKVSLCICAWECRVYVYMSRSGKVCVCASLNTLLLYTARVTCEHERYVTRASRPPLILSVRSIATPYGETRRMWQVLIWIT
jgi:hypothetical protein